MCCDLEIDVNGEHIFFLDKEILASYSNRVSNLLANFTGKTRNLKLIFNDFPGGAESFELITSFCHNNGTIDITPSNIFLLHCGSTFMEIPSLIMQTKLYLEGNHFWNWSEFINGLKQFQILFPSVNTSSFQDLLNTLLGNLNLPSYLTGSCPSSSNSSSFRFSSSDISPRSSRCNTHQDSWQFDDLSFLNIDLFEKLIKSMIFLHFDHPRICSFIFHYQRSKFFLCSSRDQKRKLSETNMNLLSLISGSAYSCRALLDAFGMSLSLNLRTVERSKLENLLGSRLDEFRINDLLIPGQKKMAFDVDLILRLIKVFLHERRINGFFVHRAKKVGFLMDLFMLEVAPDPFLKPSKFLALAMALPDISRESHDRIYQAINLYLEMHHGLSEVQNKKIWSVLDVNKLSVVRTKLKKNLPFSKQTRFKIFLNDEFVVQKFSRHVKRRTENEKRGAKVAQNTPKFMPGKPRTFDPFNVKSLPRLCH
ncbi:BTB/POZ domain-containing protein At3g22104-like [Cynara cardunculus var. scolymus]|uniref:BTB/POZ domain-containing protein At3g22104-like n=1 Tax=Cynara cardunculus var. scolymus TaxID=59895 RepID=UPI000D62A075|nr:BTB/POZ domain-containing protein At3g22104-like [Cynara cardunculus var. scolymus]